MKRRSVFEDAAGPPEMRAGWFAWTNDSLRGAIKRWNSDPEGMTVEHGHIGTWDTHEVTDISRLFQMMAGFNDDISGWDTSNVVDMSYCFDGASSFNQPIGRWNTAKVENMHSCFEKASKFNQPLANWNVSKVQDMCGYAYSTHFSP